MVEAAGAESAGQARRLAWDAAASVPDPELPFISVAELGILRGVEVDGRVAVARIAPTYTGCPALAAIEIAIAEALEEAGFDGVVERQLEPVWTTDWITEAGRSKLLAHGIAPPERAAGPLCGLFEVRHAECPRCGASETERISEFGSTACKALYRCRACSEPFEHFKSI